MTDTSTYYAPEIEKKLEYISTFSGCTVGKEKSDYALCMRLLQHFDYDEKRAGDVLKSVKSKAKAVTKRSFERRLSYLEAPTVQAAFKYFKGDKFKAGYVLLQAEKQAFKDGLEVFQQELGYIYTPENTALKGMRVITVDQ